MFSDKGAHASAVIYSLVETTKANGLNVNTYLEYLLAEMATHANPPKRITSLGYSHDLMKSKALYKTSNFSRYDFKELIYPDRQQIGNSFSLWYP